MPEYLIDGFINLLGGCNAGLAPTLLPSTQYAAGLNVSSRNGLIRTRPLFKKLATFSTGAFQGAEVYRLNDSDRVVFSIAGKVQIYHLEDGKLYSIDPPMSSTADIFHFAQADRYMVVQDGVNRPLFVYGNELLRQAADYQSYVPYDPGDPDAVPPVDPTPAHNINEVFTGTITKYGHGRIFTVATHVHANDGQPDTSTDGRPYFVAGDIIKPNDPEEVLNFTETTYLNEGGAASMPSEYGFIQGMGFFRNVQSGTGLGPLIVFAKHGVASFNINTPRSGWKETDFSQVLFSGVGTLSPRSITPLNDDLLFRALDGLRSLRYTTTQSAGGSGSLSSTPISNEVAPWLRMDESEDLRFVSIAVANNRMLMTSGGRLADTRGFNALVCLDTAATYGVSSEAVPPAYAGIWTGATFLQVLSGGVAGKPALLVFLKSPITSANELWYLDESEEAYRDGGEVGNATLCRVYTKSFDFQDMRSLKKFSHVDVWVRDLRGSASLTAYFRPDGYELWNQCTSAELVADYETDGAQAQRRYRVSLVPSDDDIFDPVTRMHLLNGNSFQICLEWEGYLAIEKVAIYAERVTEEPGVCCGEEDQSVTALVEGSGGVLLDDFTYKMV